MDVQLMNLPVTSHLCLQVRWRGGGLCCHCGGEWGRSEHRTTGLPDFTAEPSGELIPGAQGGPHSGLHQQRGQQPFHCRPW